MIVQAGSLLPCISGKVPIAAPDVIQLVYQVDRVSDRLRAGKRSKILRLVLQHPAGKDDPRKRLVGRHFDERICLVIHEHSIILRTVLLDQITLQHQRLKLRIRHDILKAADMRHHLLDLDTLIPAALEILPDTILKADRLAHIDDVVLLIMHDIDSGSPRKLF